MKLVTNPSFYPISLLFSLLATLTIQADTSKLSPPPRELSSFHIGCNMSWNSFHDFLQSGHVKGYFTFEQFWHFWGIMREQYPEHISEKYVVGKSFYGEDIHGFYMGEDMHFDQPGFKNKNIVFITALHHSREPLTLTMVMYMMIEILKERGVCGDNNSTAKDQWKRFFETNVIYFIPILNVDSYKFISANWNKDPAHEQEVLLIRKNRNVSPSCSVYTGGVDLNRNYSFMFGRNEQGSSSDPCAEDYRGTEAFSEPETQAVRDYVTSHPTIVSAINIHTYGNAWVYPFNFVHDARNNLMKRQKPKFYNFYREFQLDMKAQGVESTFGNAQGTVQYPTNGEAGDWVTEMHNVINLDPELGDIDKRSHRFYPPKQAIPQIVQYNFFVFRSFFFRHVIDIRLHQVTRNPQKKTFTFALFNKSIGSLIDFTAHVTPKFGSRSRKLKAKAKKKVPIEFQPWHVVDFKNLYKKPKEGKNRKLLDNSNLPHWHLDFKAAPDCKDKSSGLTRGEHGMFSTTLLGRNYLIIQFTFKSSHSMDLLEGIDVKLSYGHGVVRDFYFDSYSSEIKATNQRKLMDIKGEVTRRGKSKMPVLIV